MDNHEPPKILRIKRKRGQDPLQALILEDKQSAKRSKPSSPASSTVLDNNTNFYFKLTRTDESTAINEEAIVQSILAEATGNGDTSKKDNDNLKVNQNDRKRKFIIPKRQTQEDTYIPHELSDMLSSLLTDNRTVQNPKRKRRNRSVANSSPHADTEDEPEIEAEDPMDSETSDYVYDVYQLSSTEPLTSANHPQSQIGYIRFFDDDNDLYQSDDENEKTNRLFSDDEDSNAESFYQNDYPSDEDAGAYSDTFTEEGVDIIQLQSDDEVEGYEHIDTQNVEMQEEDFEDLYNELYNGSEEVNFLPDDQYQSNDEEFERNQFFENDKDDELAIHRDRIFGKLQKMINESE